MSHELRPLAAHPLRLVAVLALAVTASCKTRLLAHVTLEPTEANVSCKLSQGQNPKIDVLFMVDNSGSMDAMQAQLRTRFPLFLQVFHQLAQQGTFVDLHVGVVTSDYGAGKTGAGTGCAPSPGGNLGKLQALGRLADATCVAPLHGDHFIKYVFAETGDGASNLPPGQSLDQTFSCMAEVGFAGCGYEHQLESVHAALVNPPPENAGFLREDAVLAVVFLTNEDDCSAPPDTDLFDSNITRYGQTASFRCTRYGVMCGQPPVQAPYSDSGGPLSMCISAPNPDDMGPGRLFDIQRYIDLFTKPVSQGGLKVDPSDVLLAAIDAPEQPFQVILADPFSGTHDGKPYTRCAAISPDGSCVPVLQHSCQNPLDGAFFGDPSVRLNAVVNAAPHHAVASICDADYSVALEQVAKLIVSQTGQCCFTDALPVDPRQPQNPDAFVADCQISQVTLQADGTQVTSAIPRCSGTSGLPCWLVERKDQCGGLSPQNLGVTVRRGSGAVPPHTSIQARCAGPVLTTSTST